MVKTTLKTKNTKIYKEDFKSNLFREIQRNLLQKKKNNFEQDVNCTLHYTKISIRL